MTPGMPSAGSMPTASRQLNIVVADDVKEITALAQVWLQDAGHAVTCATCGQEVIRVMKQQQVDVAVVDVLMPDGDGLDVVMAAKQISPVTRLLAISGGGSYMTGAECLRMAKGIGADRILQKPFTRGQLISLVEELGMEVA